MNKNVTTMKDVAFKLTIFCCSYRPSIATLFYIKLILKALFCIKKTRRNIYKKMWQKFQPKFIIFLLHISTTFFSHFTHKSLSSHMHGMIKSKGMRNDNVNERMTDWAQDNKEPKMFPIIHGFPLCFFIYPTFLHMISLLKQPYIVKITILVFSSHNK